VISWIIFLSPTKPSAYIWERLRQRSACGALRGTRGRHAARRAQHRPVSGQRAGHSIPSCSSAMELWKPGIPPATFLEWKGLWICVERRMVQTPLSFLTVSLTRFRVSRTAVSNTMTWPLPSSNSPACAVDRHRLPHGNTCHVFPQSRLALTLRHPVTTTPRLSGFLIDSQPALQ
jgi:hypothetical protein